LYNFSTSLGDKQLWKTCFLWRRQWILT